MLQVRIVADDNSRSAHETAWRVEVVVDDTIFTTGRMKEEKARKVLCAVSDRFGCFHSGG